MTPTDGADGAQQRTVLAGLLAVSDRLIEPVAIERVLSEVCEAVQATLGFATVEIEWPDPASGAFRVQAAIGRLPDQAQQHSADELAALLASVAPIEGCHLLGPSTTAAAEWAGHRLLVGLSGRLGGLTGALWADRPADGRIPPADRLRALRLFANLACVALDSATRDDELRFLADHDPLTGLLNRRAFAQRLAIETARSTRYAHPLALVLCDLEGFRALNDSRGHAAGDEALRRVGQALTDALRQADVAARVGGDEFALILPETTDQQAAAVIERISDAIGAIDGLNGPLRATFGTAMSPHDGSQSPQLHQAAEAALDAGRRAAADPPADGAG